MAGRSSDSMLRQVHRLFNLGAIGTTTDAQLLDWFVSRQDEAAEAAFEELMIRHGPMVFRVCRSVLHDEHDAEDAFQAVFLVLAHRAKSIRRHGSVASWLFGVAHRVASRAKSRAAHRRARDLRVAEQTSECYTPAEACDDWAALHEEIDRLPERLRAPVTLCYLEGLTYEAAAHQLKLSEGMVRGRLARARERLSRRLRRRGVTVPAGLLVAGAAGQAQAAIPAPLAYSTIRIALGFMTGNTAAVLARGVLNSMLLNQLKVVTVLLLLGIGSSYWGWCVLAVAIDDKGQAGSRQVVGKTPAAPVSAPKAQTKAPTSVARLTGTVKLEGTGQPIAGAKLQIFSGFVVGLAMGSLGETIVETGADGQFAVDLPAGNTQVFLSDLPAGYLVPSMQEAIEDLVVKPDQPVIHKEFRVRKGTIWNFQFTRGSDQRPSPGLVVTSTVAGPAFPAPTSSRAHTDERGQARLTLPIEGGRVDLGVKESGPPASGELQTGVLRLSLEWEPGFQPDELEEISLLEGNDRRFRLIDADAKSATLQAPAAIEPVKDNGKLVIRVAIPYRDAKDFAALTGQILDENGRPIAGAHVSMVAAPGFFRVPNKLQHATTTDPRGRYRLREIPSRAIDGKPLEVLLMVTKEGHAGFQSPRLTLAEGDTVKPRVVDPIRLDRGVSLSGIVLDHRGQPVAGALVLSDQRNTLYGPSGVPGSAQTDEKGRFTIRGLLRGVARLDVFHEKVRKNTVYLADGSAEELRIKLPERMEERGAVLRDPAPPPVAVGQPAAELQVGPWSDGRARKLADLRGKVVVLYFWRLAFREGVSSLPALGKLATRFQPRGVEFLAIHHAEGDADVAQEQGRKVLAFKGAPLALAIDQTRISRHPRGMTAQAYGLELRVAPVLIVVDRAGKIAFRSDTATGAGNLNSVFTQMLQNQATEAKANEQVQRTLAGEIEKALKPKD